MKLNKLFLKYCEENQFELNKSQLDIIEILKNYYLKNFNHSFIKKIFKKGNFKIGFYLVGDVGVGKTMILNFFFDKLKEKKLRLHFNEFMINFHDFNFQNKNDKKNSIDNFVNDLSKKYEIIYFDEFQVTNIVDAMILGRLFKKIFEKNIKVIFSSNVNINDLYKDGLQREQFMPFIQVLKKNCYEKELSIKEDYRINKNIDLKRFLSPINQSTNFIFNKFFRKITKDKNNEIKVLEVKGRKITVKNFYNGIVKFDFNELCNKNLGSEDYLKIADNSKFILIENLPSFNDNNSNQQQRFITLIDIIYDKKIPIMITSEEELKLLKSSKRMVDPFKRTISRLYELTSMDFNYL